MLNDKIDAFQAVSHYETIKRVYMYRHTSVTVRFLIMEEVHLSNFKC